MSMRTFCALISRRIASAENPGTRTISFMPEARTLSNQCRNSGRSSSRSSCLTVPVRVEVPAARIRAEVGEPTLITKVYLKPCVGKSDDSLRTRI